MSTEVIATPMHESVAEKAQSNTPTEAPATSQTTVVAAKQSPPKPAEKTIEERLISGEDIQAVLDTNSALIVEILNILDKTKQNPDLEKQLNEKKEKLGRNLTHLARWADKPETTEIVKVKKGAKPEIKVPNWKKNNVSRPGETPNKKENKGGRFANKTSQYTGVYFDRNRWTALIFYGGGQHYLGRFFLEDEAAAAYARAQHEVETLGYHIPRHNTRKKYGPHTKKRKAGEDAD